MPQSMAVYNVAGTYTWVSPLTGNITIEGWGAGAGGGATVGGGGGGGAYARKNSFSVTLGNSYTVIVGAGGTAGIAVGGTGGNGGQSKFNTSTMVADGGLGGTGGSFASGGAGGSSSTGDVTHNGGAGAGSSGANGGGGGGSASGGGNGNNGSGTTGGTAGSSAGGTGNPGGQGGNASSGSGILPGGGGAGDTSTGNGGHGADGQVIISWGSWFAGPIYDLQRYTPLPDYNEWWEQFRSWPVPVGYAPPPPVDSPQPHQPGQRIDPLPIFDSWWEQFRIQPNPITFHPPHILTVQYQRFDPLPIYDEVWWNHPYPKAIPPSSYMSWMEGSCRVYDSFTGSMQGGIYLLANNIEGYLVFIGVGVPPDFTIPTYYFAELPIAIAVVPPVSGTQTYFVVVRYRDEYGLVSQNQRETTIIIDSAGNLILPAITAPTNVSVYSQAGGVIRVLSAYPSLNIDLAPADVWQVWINTVVPNPSTDNPTWVGPVSGMTTAINLSGYSPGITYYIAVALYRSEDGQRSPAIQIVLLYPAVPDEPDPVLSGFEVD